MALGGSTWAWSITKGVSAVVVAAQDEGPGPVPGWEAGVPQTLRQPTKERVWIFCY